VCVENGQFKEEMFRRYCADINIVNFQKWSTQKCFGTVEISDRQPCQ